MTTNNPIRTLSLTELRVQLTRGQTRLVEVLPRPYYDQGHLPGAVQATNDTLERDPTSVVPDRSAPVVLYCSGPTCGNSHRAAVALLARGYTDVHVFRGGKAEWVDAGLPLEVGDDPVGSPRRA